MTTYTQQRASAPIQYLCEIPRKPRANDWTTEQLATLRRMAGKAPVSEIAAVLGRTVRSVEWKAQSFGLSLFAQERKTLNFARPWTAKEVAIMRRMAATHSIGEVAAHLGRSERGVEVCAHKHRIAFQKRGEARHNTKYSAAIIEQIHVLRAQEWSTVRIGRALALSKAYVWQVVSYERRFREYMAMDARDVAGGRQS